MDMAFVADAFTLLIALIVSLTFHEAAHAFAARWQGDKTAQHEGRLTLNPLPHIDPIGTILIPMAMALFSPGLLFGWAKPVPVNVNNLRNRKWGYVLVAFAGPLSNLFLVLVCILGLNLYVVYLSNTIPEGHFLFPFVLLLKKMVVLNAFLAVFNLLPFPPLDGGSIFPALLPRNLREGFEDYIAPYGSMIIMVLIFTGGLSWLGSFAYAYITLASKVVGLII